MTPGKNPNNDAMNGTDNDCYDPADHAAFSVVDTDCFPHAKKHILSPEEQILAKASEATGGESNLPRGQFIRLITLRHMRLNDMTETKAREYATLARDFDECGSDPKTLPRDKHLRLIALGYMSLSNISEKDAMELAELSLESEEASGEFQESEFISNLAPEKFARLRVLGALMRNLKKDIDGDGIPNALCIRQLP